MQGHIDERIDIGNTQQMLVNETNIREGEDND